MVRTLHRSMFVVLLLALLTVGCVTPTPRGSQAEVHYLLGVAYLQEENPTRALDEFLKAAALNPNHADIQAGLGQAYQLKGAFNEAERHYRRALQLRPNDPTLENNLGSLFLDMKRPEQALPLFEKAAATLTFTRPEAALTGIGIARAMQGDHLGALGAYRQALDKNPRYLEAYLRTAEAHRALDDDARAIVVLEQALERAPNLARGHFQLGMIYMEDGQPELAVEFFDRVRQLVPDTELARRADQYLKVLR